MTAAVRKILTIIGKIFIKTNVIALSEWAEIITS